MVTVILRILVGNNLSKHPAPVNGPEAAPTRRGYPCKCCSSVRDVSIVVSLWKLSVLMSSKEKGARCRDYCTDWFFTASL